MTESRKAFAVTPCLEWARSQRLLGKRQRAENEDDAWRPFKRLTLATVWEGVGAFLSEALKAILNY